MTKKKEKKKFWTAALIGAVMALLMHLLPPIFFMLGIISVVITVIGIGYMILNFFISQPLLDFNIPMRIRNVFGFCLGYAVLAIVTL